MPEDTMPQVERYWNDIAEDFDSIYTGEGKSTFSRSMDRVFRRDMYERLEWVLRSAGAVKGKTVCDLGCGSGRFITEFAKRGVDRVVGVDIAPRMIELATELVKAEGVDGVCELVNADVLEFKRDEQYDVTIAIGFWDYILDPGPRLEVIRGLTRGRFLSAWPRYWTWRMPIRKARLTAAGCPVYFYKRDQVHEHLEGAGFRVVSTSVVGKLYCVEAEPASGG
jgi:SAM-dependent methyltransferase